MNVADVLHYKSKTLSTTAPDRKIKDAADCMRMQEVGALLVTEDGSSNSRLIGLISERDIVRAFSRHGDDLSTLRVKDLMIPAMTCSTSDTLRRVMSVMTINRVRHLAVTLDARPIGIISIGDVVKYRLQDLELETSVLRDTYLALH